MHTLPGVDLLRLSTWMDREALGHGPIEEVVPLAGGTQNIMVRFKRGGHRFVLRRPPVNLRANSNATMQREARVLAALAGSDVPHPGLVRACDDMDVLGAAFYLMEPVDGFNAITGLPALHAGDPAIRRAMGFALVDGAAALARVDHVAVGLADFGSAANFLERQVTRWRRQLDGYTEQPGWPGADGLPGVDLVGNYLESAIPQTCRPGILHGDYSIGNVMFRQEGPDLAAIVDWELCTIGDPLLDLGWIAATWPGAGGPELPVLRVEPFEGFPSIEEMVARYGERTGRDLSDFPWFAVLACYKLAIILEGTYARACAGLAAADTGRLLHETATSLIARALHRLERL